MPNIYLKVSLEKNWRSQNFDFLTLKILKIYYQVAFGELLITQISLNFQASCCNLKIRGLGAKLCAAFLLFDFERNYNVKESMDFAEQKYKL